MGDQPNPTPQPQNTGGTDRLATLAQQGQTWQFAEANTEFARPEPLLDQPMEITINMLRGLRMVDETVVVHGNIEPRTVAEEGQS